MVYRADNGVVENRTGRKGDVVSWAKVDPGSFRFMEIASPRTGNNNAAIYFELSGIEGQSQIWRMSSPKHGDSAFKRAEPYQANAYRSLREQEVSDGLVLVAQSRAYLLEKSGQTGQGLPASNRHSEGQDVLPSTASSVESI
ncbi:MAG: hypothetical protein KDB07_03000 [Planctomycetes bacterium]|nr:hypothetical protein [Planctomycetota bacterium]